MALKVFLTVILFSMSSFADLCAGTFSNFLVPGFQCNVGSYVFSDFSYDDPLLQGRTGNPTPGNILVSPVNGGFRFYSSEFWVGPGDSLNEEDLVFGFHISGPSSLATLEWGGLRVSGGFSIQVLTEQSVFYQDLVCEHCDQDYESITTLYPLQNGFDVRLALDMVTFEDTYASAGFFGTSFGVPEPASLILLGTGLLGLGTSIRRFRR